MADETKASAPENYYTSGEFKRDMKEVVWENRIQTIAVLLVFFLGIETIRDINKKR